MKFKLSKVGVGWGGLRCSCCAPKAGNSEYRRLMRTARRVAKREAFKYEYSVNGL